MSTKTILAVLGVVLISVGVQFIPFSMQRVSGNMCGIENQVDGLCYESGWRAGIPFQWVGGSRVNAALDSSKGDRLLVDIVTVLVVISMGGGAYWAFRKKRSTSKK